MAKSGKINIQHRLHFRIALFVIVTIVVIFGLFSAYEFIVYRQQLIDLELKSSHELSEALISCLEIAMLNEDRDAIRHSFEGIAGHENTRGVFLLNSEGTVRVSSSSELVGRTFSRDDEGCRECHDGRGSRQLPSAAILEDEPTVLRAVAPIENKPMCHRCHGDTARFNGLLVLDRSLAPVQAEIVSNLTVAGGTAVAAVLVMMLLFRWYLRRSIIDRMVHLEFLARRVVDNELDLDIRLSGKDELASVARSFNDMKETLKLSIDRIESHRTYLQSLLENLTDGIILLDADECVVFVTTASREILTVDSSALQPGRRLDFGNPPLDRCSRIGEMITAASVEDATLKEVIMLQTPGERTRYLEVHVGRLVLPPQSEPETIIVVRDITTRVVLESQASQAEKLATVGRMAAGIAHEINNPMATILTCAEGLLKVERMVDDDKGDYLQIIRDSAHRCKRITQKLLGFSATSTLSQESVDLGDILEEAVALLQFEASRKHVRLHLYRPDDLGPMIGCKDSLVQVFVNLILNGLQAVEADGEVRIDVGHVDHAFRVTVTDNGGGIDEAELGRVFDPFFTTKPVGEGTGLGLSVSRGIVRQHGGRIEIVESRQGRTAIEVVLPRTPSSREAS